MHRKVFIFVGVMKRLAFVVLIVVVFWNLENFFMPNSPHLDKIWTFGNFYRKCDAIAKIILTISDDIGQIPDIVAVEEVENRQVLKKLLAATVLRKLNYSIVHYESLDSRGIDCALLFRKEKLDFLYSSSVPLISHNGDTLKTRNILVAGFEDEAGDSLAIIVNHHPSKLSSDAQSKRGLALHTLRSIVDTLQIRNVVSGGDFNEESSLVSDSILFPLVEVKNIPARSGKSTGSIKFNGKWETIDRIQIAGNLKVTVKIFDDMCLSEKDLTYGGVKPMRTFSGPRYKGGISDHYPIIVEIHNLSTFTKPIPGD